MNCGSSRQNWKPYGDDLNVYYEETSKAVEPPFTDESAFNFFQVAAVPKNPLQRAVWYICSSTQLATSATSPQLVDPEINIFHENLKEAKQETADLMIMH